MWMYLTVLKYNICTGNYTSENLSLCVVNCNKSKTAKIIKGDITNVTSH